MVRTQHFHCWVGLGSILGQGTKVPYDVQCGQKKKKKQPKKLLKTSGCLLFLLLSYKSSLYILDTNPLSDT